MNCEKVKILECSERVHKPAVKDLIILLRHGERCDKLGIEPNFHKFDPELTDTGKRQSYDIGVMLYDYLSQKFPNNKNMYIISSPFARTIQTSKYILKGLYSKSYSKLLNFEDHIYINYFFSEYIKRDFPISDYIKFIILRNEFEKLKPELEDTKLIAMNDENGTVHHDFEDLEICRKRMMQGIKNLLSEECKDIFFKPSSSNDMEKSDYENNRVFVLVSHGSSIDEVNRELKYPGKYGWYNLKYCNAIIYDVDYDKTKQIGRFSYIDSIYPDQ